ncbi:MAG: hypothetical protein HY909_23105 [Deltaproteobacteria bacterium]|nr:hypothetical protein [Deltaproteobacteria bacterium]
MNAPTEGPPWIDAAAIAEALANAEDEADAFLGLEPGARELALGRLRGLRGGPREARARALADARRALDAPAPCPDRTELGLRFLARWLKALAGSERARALGGLEPETVRALKPFALAEPALGRGSAPVALWLVASAVALRGRPASARALGAALGALRGEATTDALGLRLERAARATGRAQAARTLAEELGAR